MGYTEKLPNGRYRVRWFDPSGRQRSKAFGLEREANRFLRNVESDIDRGVYVDDISGQVTFGEWAEQFMALASKRLARSSYARDRIYLDCHVLPRWGNVRLSRINKTQVNAWILELSEPGQSKRGPDKVLAPATIEKIYQCFRKIMVSAHEEGCIGTVPCPIHPPISRAKRKPVRFLDQLQVAALANAIDPRYRTLILVGCYGGFRIGEIAALRVDDVNWSTGHIRVDEGLTDIDGHLEFEDPKSSRGFRTVPMADLALESLHQHMERTVHSTDQRELLFKSPDGAVLRPNTWRRRFFDPAVKATGLAPLTPHDMRHTAASLFISAGANPWMLAEVLGHADARMIDRVYGHLFDKDRELLRQRMSERAASALTPDGEDGVVIDLRSRFRPSETAS